MAKFLIKHVNGRFDVQETERPSIRPGEELYVLVEPSSPPGALPVVEAVTIGSLTEQTRTETAPLTNDAGDDIGEVRIITAGQP